MNFERLQRFFWLCAGTPMEVIEKYPTEHTKYLGIGATIFFTALFAGLSGGYALYFVFSGSLAAYPASILFGILWGLSIFNLDRYIVSSIKKTSKGLRQVYQALPRFVLAILIAVVIARPLELKIFDKEIRARLKERYLLDQKGEIQKVQDAFNEKYVLELSRIAKYQQEYEMLSRDAERLREELKAEVFGTKTGTTSGSPGYGAYARNKEAVVQGKDARLAYLSGEIASLEQFLGQQKAVEGLNNRKMLDEKALDRKVDLAGFADRNWALGALAHAEEDSSRSSANAIAFITLLMIAFECAPLIVKLLSESGPSDIDIYESESRIIAQLTNTSFLNKNRMVRQYRTIGLREGRKYRKKTIGYRRGGR